jgi:hypothetical protein
MDRGRRRRPEQQTPTEDEIKARSAEVRARWTPEMEAKRRGADLDDRYEIPQNVETPEDFDPGWYD